MTRAERFSSRAAAAGLGALLLVAAGAASARATDSPADTTAPVIDSVTSADFPPIGSTPTHHAAEAGQLTVTLHDTGSGLGSVQWLLDGTMGVGDVPDSRTSGTRDLGGVAQASVTVTVTPPSWGTHTFQVRALDEAGNETQTVDYTFYVPTDPVPQVKGDLTGDGVPDLLVTDAAGDLQLLPGTGTGRFRGPILAAPGGGQEDWATTPYARMTTGLSGVDAILTHPAGSTVLQEWDNDGIGDFGTSVEQIPHPGCAATVCPSTFPTDFRGLTSFVTTGPGTTTTELVTIESGRAYAYPVGIFVNDGVPLTLHGVDLAHSDLVSPGDVDGDGQADLWVRNRLTGTVTQFAGTPDGFAAAGRVVGHGFTAGQWPVMVSVGDVTGDGTPDVVLAAPGVAVQARPVTDLRRSVQILGACRVHGLVAIEGQLLAP